MDNCGASMSDTDKAEPRVLWVNRYTCEVHLGKLSEGDYEVIQKSAYDAWGKNGMRHGYRDWTAETLVALKATGAK
jgi:hypothetical protein